MSSMIVEVIERTHYPTSNLLFKLILQIDTKAKLIIYN